MALAVRFNGSTLSTFSGTNGILISDVQHAGKNNKSAILYSLSHANKSSIPFVEYPNKPITITGYIIGASVSDCDSQIDTFNSLLTAKDANLDFDYAGGSLNRRYIATCTNIDVNRPNYLNWATFTLTFTATQPFGQDTSSTTLLNASGRTLASYSDNLTFAGTAPFQLPIITITYSAIGGAPVSGTVTIGNNTTGQGIAVNRTWAATDVLVIDCTANTVVVNSVAVDFSGAFPSFVVGTTALTYNDTFASRTFTDNVVYFKYYL